MKKISTSVYEKLTPRQRVAACIEAEARDDRIEVERLRQSCPRYTYSQLDVQYSEMMEALMGLAMAIESDLREDALGFFVTLRIDAKIAKRHLQNFANTRQAWHLALSEIGIEMDSMIKAGPPSSSTFELIEGLLPEPEMERSVALCTEMLQHFGP